VSGKNLAHRSILRLLYQRTDASGCTIRTRFVVEKLTAVKNDNERFFFYDGTSQPQSMVKSWDRIFQKVFATAKPQVFGSIEAERGCSSD
jgi:hypothetical protein